MGGQGPVCGILCHMHLLTQNNISRVGSKSAGGAPQNQQSIQDSSGI